MKRINIPDNIRILVAHRANFRCEYCKISQEDHFLAFHIDHVIALKHGGKNDIINLAWACADCNQNKGTDLATFIESDDDLIPLFNPRKQVWTEHFRIETCEIIPLTKIGKATVKLLQLNNPDILIFRQLLFQTGRYV